MCDFLDTVSDLSLPGAGDLGEGKFVQKRNFSPIVSELPTPQTRGDSAGRGWGDQAAGPV